MILDKSSPNFLVSPHLSEATFTPLSSFTNTAQEFDLQDCRRISRAHWNGSAVEVRSAMGPLEVAHMVYQGMLLPTVP